jgi:hypothetical protein
VRERFLLTLLIGPRLPVPAPKPVLESLSSVQVTVSAGQRSGFQLGFTLAKRSLLTTTLLPAGYFDPGRRVILVVTVNGFPNVLMDGIITRQEVAPSNDLGRSTLTVTGEDLSVLMDLEQRKADALPPGLAATMVATVIAKPAYAAVGLTPLVVPELFPFIASPTSQVRFSEGTDLQFIQAQAKEHGYVFYVEPGPFPGQSVAYWGPEIRIGIPQPALNVDMDAHTNVESLSFSFDGMSRTEIGLVVQEPTTKLAITVPLPPISLLRPPLAARQAPALRVEQLDDVAKLNPFQAVAKGLAKASESADAVSGSGQLDVLRYGRILKPRGLVGVRGAGRAYDGLYFVKSVTHNLRPGEYKQSFTLSRNGLISLTPAVVP